MKTNTAKDNKRSRRRGKIRAKISGTAERPRLSIFKSNTALYAQLIDDEKCVTLAGVRNADPKKLGAEIAKLAKEKNVTKVVFDRGGYIYTGKVRALAESAREAGLEF